MKKMSKKLMTNLIWISVPIVWATSLIVVQQLITDGSIFGAVVIGVFVAVLLILTFKAEQKAKNKPQKVVNRTVNKKVIKNGDDGGIPDELKNEFDEDKMTRIEKYAIKFDLNGNDMSFDENENGELVVNHDKINKVDDICKENDWEYDVNMKKQVIMIRTE